MTVAAILGRLCVQGLESPPTKREREPGEESVA